MHGHVIHVMATGALQLASCVKYEENGETTNSAFDNVLTKVAVGNNTAAVPHMTGLMLGCDTGHVFRDFIAKLTDCGSRIRSTLKCYL